MTSYQKFCLSVRSESTSKNDLERRKNIICEEQDGYRVAHQHLRMNRLTDGYVGDGLYVCILQDVTYILPVKHLSEQ